MIKMFDDPRLELEFTAWIGIEPRETRNSTAPMKRKLEVAEGS